MTYRAEEIRCPACNNPCVVRRDCLTNPEWQARECAACGMEYFENVKDGRRKITRASGGGLRSRGARVDGPTGKWANR